MNNNTQNAKIAAISEKTLVIGIDIGSESHFARAFDYRGIEYTKKAFEFSNTEAGFQEFKAFVDDIAHKQGKDKIVPGMEPTGHYWLNLGKYLQDNDMKPVHVNPHHVKKSKELEENTAFCFTAERKTVICRTSVILASSSIFTLYPEILERFGSE